MWLLYYTISCDISLYRDKLCGNVNYDRVLKCSIILCRIISICIIPCNVMCYYITSCCRLLSAQQHAKYSFSSVFGYHIALLGSVIKELSEQP